MKTDFRFLVLLGFILIFYGPKTFSQVSINSDGSVPDNSAMLEIKSTTRGFLIPRMTQSEISALVNPANGLQVFCLTDSKMYIYVASILLWKEIAYGTGTISPPFNCGTPFTINHLANNVAPVDKMVTYGTVANIPGETTKCWITGNLGADRQASSVNDATEASAGWYWQFNRAQGYKLADNGTRTPTSTWITSINEGLNWQSATDPCTIELGNGWRIPTFSEWHNVDVSGGWTNWNGPWNSALKIHAAGYLNAANGSLFDRGSFGMYWSNSQQTNTISFLLTFLSGYCDVGSYDKAYGFSIRCIKD